MIAASVFLLLLANFFRVSSLKDYIKLQGVVGPTATKSPTSIPTAIPSVPVSKTPSSGPTSIPTSTPSVSKAPTSGPTSGPTSIPTSTPSASKATTKGPSSIPTTVPTATLVPSASPTNKPTKKPTNNPTVNPSKMPVFPTGNPTRVPTVTPTQDPTGLPTSTPTHPTSEPTTDKPSSVPTFPRPTSSPTLSPTRRPSLKCPYDRTKHDNAMCAIWRGFNKNVVYSTNSLQDNNMPWSCSDPTPSAPYGVPLTQICGGTDDDKRNNWIGVSCDFYNCVVERLELIGNRQLIGTIAPQITDITSLKYLAVADSSGVHGTIPSLIGNLSRLVSFTIHNTEIGGSIPGSIDELCLVQTFNLMNNSLIGSVPDTLCHMTSLQDLDISSNHLTGDVPDTMCCLTTLTRLMIEYNKFSCFPNCVLRAPHSYPGLPYYMHSPSEVVPSMDPNAKVITTYGESAHWLIDIARVRGESQISFDEPAYLCAPPTGQPTGEPTFKPTAKPTGEPTFKPTAQPSVLPTFQPTAQPTGQPTGQPTSKPSSNDNYGYTYISGDDADHHVVAWTPLPELDEYMEAIMAKCLNNSGVVTATKDILALGLQTTGVDVPEWTFNTCGGQSHAYIAFTRWVAAIGNPTYDILTDPADVATVDFTKYKMIYLPSQKTVSQCSNKTYTLCDIEAALAGRKADLQSFLHNHRGSLFSLEQSTEPKTGIAYKTFPGVVTKGDSVTFDVGCPTAFGWFPEPLVSSVVETSNVTTTSKFLTVFDKVAGAQALIDHKFFHVAFTGPAGYYGMDVLMEDVNIPGNAYAIGGPSFKIVPAIAHKSEKYSLRG